MTQTLSKLVAAARLGDVAEVATRLADSSFNPEQFHAELALVCASGDGHIEIVAMLLEAGVSPNAEDSIGETAIMAAVTGKHPQVARLLLEAGADPDRSYGGAIDTRLDLSKLLEIE